MMARRTLVKICGLCSPEDASAASAIPGVTVVGVVLAPGPRHLELDEARKVLGDVPPHVSRAAVFVDPTVDEVERAIEVLGLRVVQLHGSETPEFCAAVNVPVVKTFRVGWGFDLSEIEPYRDLVLAVLLDSFVPGVAGGTGTTFRWDPSLRVSHPAMMIAGGLTPGNVADAMRIMRPTAVDVSSGVESRPRRKDPELMRAFVEAVRKADEEVGGP